MSEKPGPPSTISAGPRLQPIPQRFLTPERRTNGRKARPDQKKRGISRSTGVSPALGPGRVAAKPSAQQSGAPTPQATPRRAGLASAFLASAFLAGDLAPSPGSIM